MYLSTRRLMVPREARSCRVHGPETPVMEIKKASTGRAATERSSASSSPVLTQRMRAMFSEARADAAVPSRLKTSRSEPPD